MFVFDTLMKEEAKILIIDDDPAVLATAKLLLKQLFTYVHTLESPDNLYKILEEIDFDIILLDMNYSRGENDGVEGLRIIDGLIKNFPSLDVIPITAYGDIDLAVEVMKKGVRDFITKPWQNEKLLTTIRNILQLRKAGEQIKKLSSLSVEMSSDQVNQMIGNSSAYLKVVETANKVAGTDADVLILGENGTGKELMARFIHFHSARADKPFVSIDLGSLKDTLFESELFGHKKGAYTDAKEDRTGKLELVSGGTLFLDEIGNLTISQQSKLLTVLQNREITPVGSNHRIKVDFRLITATNSDLKQAIITKEFREDLLYRINTIEIQLPPLRDRIEDIKTLAEFYFEKFRGKYQKPQLKIQENVFKHLEQYSWPGNIRELSHVMERAVILAGSNLLTPMDFPLTHKTEDSHDSLNLQEMEKSLILKALEKNKGNITRAAKDLGIDRLALYRRLEKYGL